MGFLCVRLCWFAFLFAVCVLLLVVWVSLLCRLCLIVCFWWSGLCSFVVCLVARLFDGWFAEIVRLLFCADLLFLVCVFCVSGLPPSTSIPYWVFLVVFPSLLRLPCWSPTLRSIYIFMGVSLYIFLSGQGERRFSSGDRVCPVRVPRPQEKIYI